MPADLDPRIHGAPPVPASSSQGQAQGQGPRPDDAAPGVPAPPGHGDRAQLSSAARTLLVRGTLAVQAVSDPDQLADETAEAVRSSVAAAGAVHTSAVFRAARLIR